VSESQWKQLVNIRKPIDEILEREEESGAEEQEFGREFIVALPFFVALEQQ